MSSLENNEDLLIPDVGTWGSQKTTPQLDGYWIICYGETHDDAGMLQGNFPGF